MRSFFCINSNGRFSTGRSFRNSSLRLDTVRIACKFRSNRSASALASSFLSASLVVASSAAADGVGARKSETKSAIVKSVSCPTAEITGSSEAKMALATLSSLNAHKSSIEPPPRPRIITSALPQLFASFRLLTISAAAASPCTSVGNMASFTLGSRLFAIWIISRTAAPVGEVITAIQPIFSGISRL